MEIDSTVLPPAGTYNQAFDFTALSGQPAGFMIYVRNGYISTAPYAHINILAYFGGVQVGPTLELNPYQSTGGTAEYPKINSSTACIYWNGTSPKVYA